MKLKNNSLLLVIIVLLAGFLRFYQLDSVPNGLYQDETSIGYSAYSILQTGRDEYGKFLPLYFKSFGDQKLPVYIYSTVPSVKIFGLTPFAVRFPSAIFGTLSVLALYFFVRDITKDRKLGLTSSFFLAVNPWSLHYNRATFEVSIALFFFLLGGLLLNRFFVRKTRGAFLAGTLCFIISLYSYNLTRLLAPLLFAIFIFANRDRVKSAARKEVILSAFTGLILLVPFAVSFFEKGGVSSAAGTLIHTSAVVQAPILEMRSYMNALPMGGAMLFFNKFALTFWQYVSNVASYLSVNFFFLKGSLHGNHGIGNVGQFYLFELPLIISGLVYLIKKKVPGTFLLLGWGIITVLVASLTREAPHATRSFFLVVPLTVFSAAGLIYFYKLLSGLRHKLAKALIAVVACGFIIFNFVYYFSSYYIRFPALYAKDWRAQDKELVSFFLENDAKYDKIIIDPNSHFIYTSHLFYAKYSPEDFQKLSRRLPDDSEGFSKVSSYGKFEYREVNWEEDTKKSRTLIVISPAHKPYNRDKDYAIYYPYMPRVFAKNQVIHTLTLRDEAYILFETK
jgi:4-amino-4-deoxy-L-arabinose transferase-like glycosyltransferase